MDTTTESGGDFQQPPPPGSKMLGTSELVIIAVVLILVLVAIVVLLIKCFELKKTAKDVMKNTLKGGKKKRKRKSNQKRRRRTETSSDESSDSSVEEPVYSQVNQAANTAILMPPPAPQPQGYNIDAPQRMMNLPANGNVIIDGTQYTIMSATAVPTNAVPSNAILPQQPQPMGNALPQQVLSQPPPQQMVINQMTPIGNGIYGVIQQNNPAPQPQPQPQPQREILLNPATIQTQSPMQSMIITQEQPQAAFAQPQAAFAQPQGTVPATTQYFIQSPDGTMRYQSAGQLGQQTYAVLPQQPQVSQVQVQNTPKVRELPASDSDGDLPPMTTVSIAKPAPTQTYGSTEIMQPDSDVESLPLSELKASPQPFRTPQMATYDPAHTEFMEQVKQQQTAANPKPKSILVRNGSQRKNSMRRAPRPVSYRRSAVQSVPSRNVAQDGTALPNVTYVRPTSAYGTVSPTVLQYSQQLTPMPQQQPQQLIYVPQQRSIRLPNRVPSMSRPVMRQW